MIVTFEIIIYFAGLIFAAGIAWSKINSLKLELAKIKAEHIRPIYKEIDDLKQVKASNEMVDKLEKRLFENMSRMEGNFNIALSDLKTGQAQMMKEIHEIFLTMAKRETDK